MGAEVQEVNVAKATNEESNSCYRTNTGMRATFTNRSNVCHRRHRLQVQRGYVDATTIKRNMHVCRHHRLKPKRLSSLSAPLAGIMYVVNTIVVAANHRGFFIIDTASRNNVRLLSPTEAMFFAIVINGRNHACLCCPCQQRPCSSLRLHQQRQCFLLSLPSG